MLEDLLCRLLLNAFMAWAIRESISRLHLSSEEIRLLWNLNCLSLHPQAKCYHFDFYLLISIALLISVLHNFRIRQMHKKNPLVQSRKIIYYWRKTRMLDCRFNKMKAFSVYRWQPVCSGVQLSWLGQAVRVFFYLLFCGDLCHIIH